MKLKILMEVPTNNIIYVFLNSISYMVNDKLSKSKIELFNYLDDDMNINQPWRNIKRFGNLITNGRCVVTNTKNLKI